MLFMKVLVASRGHSVFSYNPPSHPLGGEITKYESLSGRLVSQPDHFHINLPASALPAGNDLTARGPVIKIPLFWK
ncbi:MAG: hypothetical protein D3910_20840 [Candidatus Electrothrix sp. ATG2]|nr:hypothetical protein [Candidatus Electrothrix sp. ATG2]